MTLSSWWDAFAFALGRLRLERWEAIEYADRLFPCPGCGEDECGASCGMMLDDLAAAIEAAA